MIKKLKAKNAEAEVNIQKAESNYMVDLEALIHKILVDPNWKYVYATIGMIEPLKKLPVFSELNKRFGLLFAGDKIVDSEELKKRMLEALHFDQPGAAKRWPRVSCSGGTVWDKT